MRTHLCRTLRGLGGFLAELVQSNGDIAEGPISLRLAREETRVGWLAPFGGGGLYGILKRPHGARRDAPKEDQNFIK